MNNAIIEIKLTFMNSNKIKKKQIQSLVSRTNCVTSYKTNSITTVNTFTIIIPSLARHFPNPLGERR